MDDYLKPEDMLNFFNDLENQIMPLILMHPKDIEILKKHCPEYLKVISFRNQINLKSHVPE